MSLFRTVIIALAALSIFHAPPPAQAGLFKKLGAAGVVVAGVETATTTNATVDAIAMVGTAAYLSTVTDLRSKVAAHRFLGPSAVKLGIAAWLRLEPRKLAAALAVKSDTIGDGGAASRQVSAPNSAAGDPNDNEPDPDQDVLVKRPLRADDMGLKPENVSELRGQVSLEGNTLTVRIDMIRGVGPPQEETLRTSGLTIMRSLQALARENGRPRSEFRQRLPTRPLKPY